MVGLERGRQLRVLPGRGYIRVETQRPEDIRVTAMLCKTLMGIKMEEEQ